MRRVRARNSPRRRGVDVVGDAAGDGLARCRRRCGAPRDVDAVGDVADSIGADAVPGGGVSTGGGGWRGTSEGGSEGVAVDAVVAENKSLYILNCA